MRESVFWKCVAVLAVAVIFLNGNGQDRDQPVDAAFTRSVQAAGQPNAEVGQLVWDTVPSSDSHRDIDRVYRCKVPGGWLIQTFNNRRTNNQGEPSAAVGLVFFPDAHHTWGGGSLP